MTLLQLAVTIFLIMDPIGNIPAFVALLKNIPPKRQRTIIFRELIIALCIILFFNFLGDQILSWITITHTTVQLAGGVILFLISLQMIFPKADRIKTLSPGQEPFIIPLAVPLIAGPSIIAAVMLYAHQQENLFITTYAILIAWVFATLVLLSSVWLQRFCGSRVLLACERLMGLVITILAVDMFSKGIVSLLT